MLVSFRFFVLTMKSKFESSDKTARVSCLSYLELPVCHGECKKNLFSSEIPMEDTFHLLYEGRSLLLLRLQKIAWAVLTDLHMVLIWSY